jgi:hypothetical protein
MTLVFWKTFASTRTTRSELRVALAAKRFADRTMQPAVPFWSAAAAPPL